MDTLLDYYEDEYELGLTECNKTLKNTTPYLDSSKTIFYSKIKNTFTCSHTQTIMEYIKSKKNEKPSYLNFIYSSFKTRNFIISYNFVYRIINVYMGKGFNEEELDKFTQILPRFEGFKIIKNEERTSFRCYDVKYESIILDNIIKFMSNNPEEYKKYVSQYILKSFNYFVRLKSYEQLDNLHKNLNLLEMSNTFINSNDNKYIIVLKHLNPSSNLVVNIGDEKILVNIYDRQHNIIHVLELPQFSLIQVSEIIVYVLYENYEINIEECYNLILTLLTNLFFHKQPLNNNSPSSE